MTDLGNTRGAIARRIRAPREAIKHWAARHPADGWIVTSREAGQVPREARDGATFAMVVGPFNTRRAAHGARMLMRGES